MAHLTSHAARSLAQRASLELEHKGSAELTRTTSKFLQAEVRGDSLNKEILGVGVLGFMGLKSIETLGASSANDIVTTAPDNSSLRLGTDSTQGRDDTPTQGAHRDRIRESQEPQQESPQNALADLRDDSMDHLLDCISDYTLSLASDRSATSTYRGSDLQNLTNSPKIVLDPEDRLADLPDNSFDHSLDNVSGSILSCPSDLRAEITVDRSVDQAYIQSLDQTSQRHSPNTIDLTTRESIEQALEESHDSPSDFNILHDPNHISINTAAKTSTQLGSSTSPKLLLPPFQLHKHPFQLYKRPLWSPQHPSNRFGELELSHRESRTYSSATAPVDQSIASGWNVTDYPIEQLTLLPRKIEHPGGSRYIGVENKGKPKWLYDSVTNKTVRAEDYMFEQGYMAVSYTWGRWRLKGGWHQELGTPWDVPTILRHQPGNPIECKFDMAELKEVLRRMPDVRYFWIDVLCINQGDQNPEKDEEIAKQGAIFKEARGVLVYLWSIDDGKQLAAALRELGDVLRFYWTLPIGVDHQAAADWKDRQPHIGAFGKALQTDPWFTSLWTLQETILAPASIWTARDGSFCQVLNDVLTTNWAATRFRELDLREEASDELETLQFNPTRHNALSALSKFDEKFTQEFLNWAEWASKTASITTCLSASRMGILLAASKRKATACRGLAVLAALKVGFHEKYKEDSEVAGNLPIDLLNDIMIEEGGAFFDCVHNSSGPLTNMLPTTADAVCAPITVATPCNGWTLKQNGELCIPRGSVTNQHFSHEKMELRFSDKSFCGGDPEVLVKGYLLQKGILVEHVKFLVTGYSYPLWGDSVANSDLQEKANIEHLLYLVSNDRPLPERNSAGARGVVLVTTMKDICDKNCRWHKAGIYFSREFRNDRLEYDITVRA